MPGLEPYWYDLTHPAETGTFIADLTGLALFTATTPGTYTFYCRIPGHTEAGMVGMLIVEP